MKSSKNVRFANTFRQSRIASHGLENLQINQVKDRSLSDIESIKSDNTPSRAPPSIKSPGRGHVISPSSYKSDGTLYSDTFSEESYYSNTGEYCSDEYGDEEFKKSMAKVKSCLKKLKNPLSLRLPATPTNLGLRRAGPIINKRMFSAMRFENMYRPKIDDPQNCLDR